MNNGEVLSISSSLELVKRAYSSVDENGAPNIEQKIKFTHALIKNKSLFDAEADPIKEAVKLKGDALEYENARLELCREMCLKDENGNPIVKNGGFSFEDRESFDKAIAELQKKHKKGVEDRENQIKELESYLSEDFYGEIDFKKIDSDDLPSNLPIGLYEAISFMIR